MPISPNSSWQRKRGERSRSRQSVQWWWWCNVCPSLCVFRELDDSREKTSEDSQNGGEISKFKSKHVRHAQLNIQTPPKSHAWLMNWCHFLCFSLQDKYLMDMDELFSQVDEKRKVWRNHFKMKWPCRDILTITEISLVQNPASNNCTLNISVFDWLFTLMLCNITCAEARDPRLPVWEDQLWAHERTLHYSQRHHLRSQGHRGTSTGLLTKTHSPVIRHLWAARLCCQVVVVVCLLLVLLLSDCQ